MKKRFLLNIMVLVMILMVGGSIGILGRNYRIAQANHALILAIKKGDTQEALEALAASASPDARASAGDTVTFQRYLSLLWNQLRGIPPPTGKGLSAIGLAVEQNNTKLIEALLDRGAHDSGDTLKVTYTRNTEVSAPLVMAAANQKNADVVQAMARHGWDVNAPAEDGSTALFAADDAATVKALAAYGAKLNVSRKYSQTALDIALYNRNDAVAVALVDLGAYDPDALANAVIFGDIGALKAMIRHGWNLDTTVRREYGSGHTPLIEAMEVGYGGSPQAILLLIQSGADVNKSDGTGWTPLMSLASCTGPYDLLPSSPKLMQAFIERGAHINAQDNAGLTPLMCAATCKNTGLIRILLQHGARVNMRTREGKTALYFASNFGAVERGNPTEAIRTLKSAGATF